MTDFPPQPPMGTMMTQRPGNGLAVASLVLGIISLVLFCIWYISMPCAILAIIFGLVGRSKAAQGASGRGLATGGLICGLIAIGIVVLFVAGCLAMLGLGGAAALQDAANAGMFETVDTP